MTAQFQHRYINKSGEVFLSPGSPFNPEEHGIIPRRFTVTSCRSGYVCEFIDQANGSWILNRLLIRMKPLKMDRGEVPLDAYPLINGKTPRNFRFGAVIYEKIGLSFNFVIPEKQKNLASQQHRFLHYCFSNPFKMEPNTPQKTKIHTIPPAKRKKQSMFRDHLAYGYDIIGDIHGHADELERLLEKLGYSSNGKRHPKRRRLIFLGDLIDRGPKNRRVIEVVRTLIRSDLAYAVMGNHEYNAICYHTKAAGGGDQYLREHSEKNIDQHQSFLKEYENEKELKQVVQWFQSLPLFLDLGDLRIVHACWDQTAINFVYDFYYNRLTNEFLYKSVYQENSQEDNAIETLLKGPERSLRKGLEFSDNDNNPRQNFRLKWWSTSPTTLGDVAILPSNFLLRYGPEPLRNHCDDAPVKSYPSDAPLVVFGHYSTLPVEESFTTNTACLDQNIIKGGNLACLRWNKSEKNKHPSDMEIVSVPADESINARD